MGKEIIPFLMKRHGVARVVPERSEAVVDALPLWDGREIIEGELVLLLNPLPRRSGVEVLQRPVRIADFSAEKIVGLVGLRRGRIMPTRLGLCGKRGSGDEADKERFHNKSR